VRKLFKAEEYNRGDGAGKLNIIEIDHAKD